MARSKSFDNLDQGGLTLAEDNQDDTVMTESYRAGAAVTPHYGAYDLAALQYLYGTDAGETARRAGTSPVFDGADTLAGGSDSLTGGAVQ